MTEEEVEERVRIIQRVLRGWLRAIKHNRREPDVVRNEEQLNRD